MNQFIRCCCCCSCMSFYSNNDDDHMCVMTIDLLMMMIKSTRLTLPFFYFVFRFWVFEFFVVSSFSLRCRWWWWWWWSICLTLVYVHSAITVFFCCWPLPIRSSSSWWQSLSTMWMIRAYRIIIVCLSIT